jgi:peptidyl-prolyl cis-trans isomerase B (cyclophilin B)
MKIIRIITAILLAALFALPVQAASTTQGKTKMVKLHTNHGIITIQLDAEKAPISSKNFLDYVNAGFYNNVVFHRVIPNFMIQGGGFEPGMKQKPVNAAIQNEAANGLKNEQYTIAMARTGDPHSATAQFFINTKNNSFLTTQDKTAGVTAYSARWSKVKKWSMLSIK